MVDFQFGVVMFNGPIAPEPVVSATDVVPVTVPAPVIVPVVEAVNDRAFFIL